MNTYSSHSMYAVQPPLLDLTQSNFHARDTHAQHGVAVLSASGNIRFCNAILLRWLGASLHESIGKPITAFLPDLLCGVTGSGTAPNKTSGTRQRLHLHRLDGSKRVVEVSIAALQLDNDQPLVLLIERDEHARDKKRSMEDLRLSAMHSSDAIAITNNAGRFEFVNDAFEALTGFCSDELCGRCWSDLLTIAPHHPSFADFTELVAALYNHGTSQHCISLRKKNGSLVQQSQRVRRFVDNDGVTSHWVFVGATIDAHSATPLQDGPMYYDALTRLPARALTLDRLDQVFKQAMRSQSGFSVAILDIDGLQAINDHWGYTIGDAVLHEIALRIKNSLRAVDSIGRLADDEFLIILSDIDQVSDAVAVIDKVEAACRASIPTSEGAIWPSVSIGSALYPCDGSDRYSLLRRADCALQRIKSNLSQRNRTKLDKVGLSGTT